MPFFEMSRNWVDCLIRILCDIEAILESTYKQAEFETFVIQSQSKSAVEISPTHTAEKGIAYLQEERKRRNPNVPLFLEIP